MPPCLGYVHIGTSTSTNTHLQVAVIKSLHVFQQWPLSRDMIHNGRRSVCRVHTSRYQQASCRSIAMRCHHCPIMIIIIIIDTWPKYVASIITSRTTHDVSEISETNAYGPDINDETEKYWETLPGD